MSRPRLAVAAVLGVAVLASLGHAVALTTSPDALPTWDSAGYLLEAEKLRGRIAALDARAVAESLTHPDLHPPLHNLGLALWQLATGAGLGAARAYAAACFLVGLGLLVPIARRLYGRDGLLVGLGAAFVTASSLGNLGLATTPMTEATALVTTNLALWAMVRFAGERGLRAQLLVGGAILLAALTRYNLGPMLLAGLVLAEGWELRATPRAALDPRRLAWVLPTVLVFAGWQVLRPELADNVRKFMENRSSGLDFWSVENLGFVPIAMTDAYVGTWAMTVLLGAGWLAGALASPGTRRLAAWALVSFAALTWHDFKIARNLAVVLPAFHVVALGGLAARLRGRAPAWVAPAALIGLGLPWAGWMHATRIPKLAEQADARPDPQVRQALDFLVAKAEGHPQIWVTGWMFRLSPNLIDWWFRVHAVPAKLKLDQPLHGNQDRTGVDSSWNPAYRTEVQDGMLAAAHRDRTVYVTIETPKGGRYWDGWKAFGNNYAQAFREQDTVAPVDTLALDGMVLRAYAGPGSGDARAPASASPPPAPGAPASPPASPARWTASFDAAAPWSVYPPDAPGVVAAVRDGALHVEVGAAHPALQVCAPLVPNPGAGTARAEARLAGVSGRPWLHLRAMDAQGLLRKRPDGSAMITQLGPVVGDGAWSAAVPLDLGAETAQMKVCLVLDGVAGTLDLVGLRVDAP